MKTRFLLLALSAAILVSCNSNTLSNKGPTASSPVVRTQIANAIATNKRKTPLPIGTAYSTPIPAKYLVTIKPGIHPSEVANRWHISFHSMFKVEEAAAPTVIEGAPEQVKQVELIKDSFYGELTQEQLNNLLYDPDVIAVQLVSYAYTTN